MKTISKAVIKDAKTVCCGLYRMNAKYSVGYAFTITNDNKEVNTGEFIHASKLPVNFHHYDGYIDFHDATLENLETGKVQKI